MKYKHLNNEVVSKIDDDGISRMSCSVSHPEYLVWLAEGNIPEPADVPASVVNVVSMRQCRLVLLNNGILDAVVNALNSISDTAQKQAALIEWEYSNEVKKDSPLVQFIAAQLNLTSNEITMLFNEASVL